MSSLFLFYSVPLLPSVAYPSYLSCMSMLWNEGINCVEEMRVKSLQSGVGQGSLCEKKDPFYSWHGSVRNATLGRRHPLHSFSSPVPLSRSFSLSPLLLAISLPRETWLPAKTAGSLGRAWWSSLRLFLFGTMTVKMLLIPSYEAQNKERYF